LSGLVVHSLGPPEFYDAGTDKARLQPLMRRAGIRVPEYVVATSAADAAAAARELGPQVVLKPSNGTGGRDVILCDTPQGATEAFHRVLAGNRQSPGTDREPSVLIQRRIVGQMIGRTSVAYRGVELAGFARERLKTMAALGGSTVVRYVHAPEPAAFSRAIAATLGITGFLAIEYCVDHATHETYLIDLTRRMAPPTHTGRLVGVDLCAALAAALRGEAVEPLDVPVGFSRTMTLFPQELWRDPESPALHQNPMDVPWDDPALLRELLHWRYDING
jgi:biotin carboxylase